MASSFGRFALGSIKVVPYDTERVKNLRNNKQRGQRGKMSTSSVFWLFSPDLNFRFILSNCINRVEDSRRKLFWKSSKGLLFNVHVRSTTQYMYRYLLVHLHVLSAKVHVTRRHSQSQGETREAGTYQRSYSLWPRWHTSYSSLSEYMQCVF